MCLSTNSNPAESALWQADAAGSVVPQPNPSTLKPHPLPSGLSCQAPVKKRLKLWELEDRLHCPVVGTCFTIEEIKKLAHKGGFKGAHFDDYRLHVEAVNLSCSRNAVSEAMQKLLEGKFDLVLRRFAEAKTEAALRALWEQHLERGEVAAAMWATLSHKQASAEIRSQVYADVHRLSHQVGAAQDAPTRPMIEARSAPPRIVTASDLLGEDRLLCIRHQDRLYRLSLTRGNKLILTA